jgi:subtilase-type serine protease
MPRRGELFGAAILERGRSALLLFTAMLGLSACVSGGGGSADDATGLPGGAVLSSFFVESFAAFETQARDLVASSPRYLSQLRSWYFDDNGNGVRDPGTEPLNDTYPLQSSGAQYAHAAGLTGAGQIVAIVDDGFRISHEAFAGTDIEAAGAVPIEDHGTFVSSIVTGDSSGMIGMAPGADLIVGSYLDHNTRALATRLAEERGAVAQNNSWNFVNAPVGTTSYGSVFSGASGQDYLAALRSYAGTGVVIFAASNDRNAATASLMPALPALVPDLEAGWIAAINGDAVMNGNDVVAARRISSACLEAAAWCLAAEGAWLGATGAADDSYSFAVGTSYAAPMIAGAMALLAEAFPGMSPHDLRVRLLASADNTFTGFNATGTVELVPGYVRDISEEWGHGFLDVRAALLPIGRTTATMADGTTHDISEPLAFEGTASGDAVAQSLRAVALVVDDAFDARFSLPADMLVARPTSIALGDELRLDWERGRTDCCGTASYHREGETLFVHGDDMSVTLLMPSPAAPEDAGFALAIERRFGTDDFMITASASLGEADEALLPRWRDEAVAVIAAGELTVEANLGARFGLGMSAAFGSTIADTGPYMSAMSFDSAEASLSYRGLFAGTDRFSASVGFPVAITRGRTIIELPVMTADGSAGRRDVAIDLAPTEREMRVGFDYVLPVGPSAELTLAARYVEDRANQRGRREAGMLLGFRMRF